MDYSEFGQKFTRGSGILELMDDLGTALAEGGKFYMLGGGNPAEIPEINAIWRRRMEEILGEKEELEAMLVHYDKPQGQRVFLEALADLFNREYGWDLSEKNIAITNGSQTSSFILMNLFSGTFGNGKKRKILFPLSPEYIGYADQAIEKEAIISYPSAIEMIDDFQFKYRVNFNDIQISKDIGGICISRPTNPTGNVLTDTEVKTLAEYASCCGIPLIVDNAYGTPFPNIIFEKVKPIWNENIIITMSLSKLGLPSARTGIVIASEEVIQTLSSMNAVISLANASIGPVITGPLIRSGEILRISRDIIQPYYREKSERVQNWIRERFGDAFDYRVHKSEGAIFLWIWFRGMPITSYELYRRLKARKVLVVPGNYFFFGLTEEWSHRNECIRINYAGDEEDIKTALEIIADEVRGL
jgi:valine--pyruvate aminotransferase